MKTPLTLVLVSALLLPCAVTAATNYNWTAYNDLYWFTNQWTDTNKVTYYTAEFSIPTNLPPGFALTQGGPLRDYNSGQALQAYVTISGGGFGWEQGQNPSGGTPAAPYFNGIIDCLGFVDYNTNTFILRFTNLNPKTTYEFVAYGDRNNPDYYATRWTWMSITDVVAFVNESSDTNHFGGPTDPTTAARFGYNNTSGEVVRFTGIKTGPDGDFSIVTPYDSNLGQIERYYVNAFMIREVPEPAAIIILGLGTVLFGLRRRRR